jgi:hypothetical protein
VQMCRCKVDKVPGGEETRSTIARPLSSFLVSLPPVKKMRNFFFYFKIISGMLIRCTRIR